MLRGFSELKHITHFQKQDNSGIKSSILYMSISLCKAEPLLSDAPDELALYATINSLVFNEPRDVNLPAEHQQSYPTGWHSSFLLSAVL